MKKIFGIFLLVCIGFCMSASAEPKVYVRDMEIYISGETETKGGLPVGVMAVDKGADISELPVKIQYINQVVPDSRGKYSLYFNTDSPDFDLYINDNGQMKMQYEGMDYSKKAFIACDLSVEATADDMYLLNAELDNIFGDDAKVDLYAAFYDGDDRLVGVESYEVIMSSEDQYKNQTLTGSFPESANRIKAFAWIDFMPLTDTEFTYKADEMPDNIFVKADKDNYYLENEEIYFTIRGEKDEEILYSISDFWGEEVASGEVVTNVRDYRWKMPDLPMGYYVLSLEYDNERYPQTHNEYLAVLTDYNFSEIEDSPFGINSHLQRQSWGWKPELVDYMALMGAKSIRDGQEWKSVEKEKGVYTILDEEIGFDLVRKYNMNMNLATGYGNEIYEGQIWFPWSQEGREAYTNYQLAMMEEFKDIVTEVDVWNEWYGGGDPLVSVYGDLLRSCYHVTKEKYPDVKILGNAIYATQGEYKDWYKQLLEFWPVRLFTLMDGIFPHMYPGNDPESRIPEQAEGLKNLNAEYGKEDLELYMTELGAMTGDGGVTEEEQASILVRSYSLALANGYKKIYWYDFMEDGNASYEPEYNFGLIHYEQSPKGSYSPKPAYVAYAVMTRMLTGYECTSMRMLGDNSDIYCVSFANGDDVVNVVWSLDEQILKLNEERDFTDIMGGEHFAESININMYPIYLKGSLD